MSGPDVLARRLAGRRSAARRVLWFERLWPAVWPALGLAGAWIALALFEVPAALPGTWHIAALVALVVGVIALSWRGVRRVRAPRAAEVDRRLERSTGLRHRPLMTLTDRPAMQDADSLELWQTHLARATAQIGRLRVGWPHPVLAASDRYALRGLLVVALAAGLIVAGADAPSRVLRSFTPVLPTGPATPEPQLQAWITPPGYTRLPPVFLKPGETLATPAASALTVSLTGGTDALSLTLAGQVVDVKTLDPSSWQADDAVGAGGELIARRNGRELGHWTLAIQPDHPPMVAWAQPPGPAPRSQRKLAVRLPWTAEDDYGIASVQTELRLKDRPAADPFVVPIALAGAPKQAHGAPSMDLTANPWAGLPVVAVLVAKDAPGQTGTSAPAEFVLPERSFHNPVARAVIDIRKRLSLDPDKHTQAADDLAALAEAPAAFDNNTSVILVLGNTASQLQRSGAKEDIAEAQARLWALALSLDDDAVGRTAQAVQQARDALKQADKGPITDLDRKAEALRQAIQKHLQALAEKARRDGTLMPFDPQARTLSSEDFNKLTQEMRDAAKAGRMDEARDKLAQLERMLDQLKAAEANPGDRKKTAEQRRRGQQGMGAAEDMVQRETAMKQHIQDRAAKPEGSEAKGAQDAQRSQEARQQRAMRRALGTMMQQFGDLTGKVPEELGQADLAMRDSATALEAGKDGPAGQGQQRAIEALQKGEQSMSQQMASSLGISIKPGEGEGEGPGQGQGNGQDDGDGQDSQMSQDDGEGQSGRGGEQDATGQNGPDGEDNTQRDPLGRATKDGNSGRADSGDVHVPDQMEQARTRDIQTELRRRGADRSRPADELDYIDRLLKSF